MQKLESGNEECKGRNALAPVPFREPVRASEKVNVPDAKSNKPTP